MNGSLSTTQIWQNVKKKNLAFYTIQTPDCSEELRGDSKGATFAMGHAKSPKGTLRAESVRQPERAKETSELREPTVMQRKPAVTNRVMETL